MLLQDRFTVTVAASKVTVLRTDKYENISTTTTTIIIIKVSVISSRKIAFQSKTSASTINHCSVDHHLGIYTDADLSRQTNHVLRCSPPVVPDPSSATDSHVPDARSGSGTLATRLQQCTVLVGIPAYLVHVRRLQTMLNAAARLIYHLRPYDHISDALATLHWLCVPERVQYNIAVLTLKVLHDNAPYDICDLLSALSKYQPPSRAAHQAVYC